MRLTQPRYPVKFGQSLLEYSLGAGLIALVCVGALSMLGGSVSKGFHSILPAPSSGSLFKAGVSSDVEVPAALSSQSTNGSQSGSNSSSKVLDRYQSIVQTSGSLGDEQVLFHYSDQLVAKASSFQADYPELFNKIVELGMVGKEMAKLMTTYQKSPSQGNNIILGSSSVDYDYAWAAVENSPEYASLSAADKAFLDKLAHESMYLADDVLYLKGKVVNPDGVVDSNSDQIIVCGKNMKCN